MMANVNPGSVDDVAVNRRYEGLVAVRTKAVKGKGTWYWAHFEPVLIRSPETNEPKAVKLKCTLCGAAFSASNPSRTASEHLKNGACPKFSLLISEKPINWPLHHLSSHCFKKNHHKRTSTQFQQLPESATALDVHLLNMVDSCPLVLSGGKEDYGPLALLENSVKNLRSPKTPVPSLAEGRVKEALNLLSNWFYESCGPVSFTNLEHPKFKAFLHLVGLPPLSTRDFSGFRLDSKFEEARMRSEAKINDVAFFQVAVDGWKIKDCVYEKNRLVKFMVNLPNGTSVFQKSIYFEKGELPSEYAEEVLLEAIQEICGNNLQRCVGIIADKYKAKALKNLEMKYHWMVNLPCLLQGLLSLIKDLYREIPLFRTVTESGVKIGNFINSTQQVRNSFLKLIRLQGLDFTGFIRVPSSKCDVSKNLSPFVTMLGDLLGCSQILNTIVSNDSYKVICSSDVTAREVADLVQDIKFWNNVEAAHSLLKLIMEMAKDVEADRPLVGQCIPLWDELRTKLKDWCSKYNFPEGPIHIIVERRFRKTYHPAWSAAFILDPFYLFRDSSGKYLPTFDCLTDEEEKDMEKLITRLVSKEEAHAALMELMRWRSEGLDPLYARAVQVKKRDPLTGKLKIANPQSSRLVWETCLKGFESLGKVAARVLFLQGTCGGVKCDWSIARQVCGQRSRLGLERVEKVVFVAAHAKLERRDFSCGEERDDELFETMISGEDEMINEVLEDASFI